MLFETPTQFAVLALALIAGWFFGLASHPGGKKWKQKYRDEQASHTAVMKEREGVFAEREARVKELEAENARLTRELDRNRPHGSTATTAAVAGATGVAAGTAASGTRGGGLRGFFGWDRDNLSRINGVDEVTEKALVADGIKSFEQIAALSDAEAHALEDKLGFGRDRIDQQQWREQARLMMENHDRDHGIARA